MSDRFVVHRLRSKPVEYTVTIRHFVSGDQWMIGVAFDGVVPDSAEERRRVALDLKCAATMLEENSEALP
jgi:hypothetical protein